MIKNKNKQIFKQLPVIRSTDFPPRLSDPKFRSLLYKNVFRLMDFRNTKGWKFVSTIHSMVGPSLPIWHAFQLRHFLLSLQPSHRKLPDFSNFELRSLQRPFPLRHGLSIAYSALSSALLNYVPPFLLALGKGPLTKILIETPEEWLCRTF